MNNPLGMLFNMFGGQQGLNNQIQNFGQKFQQENPGMHPQAMVQQMMNNGQMTQEQFQYYVTGDL